jgi:hypothetical protein
MALVTSSNGQDHIINVVTIDRGHPGENARHVSAGDLDPGCPSVTALTSGGYGLAVFQW